MDPITAFSLAAGILQVVDISSKAIAKCHEVYKNGSLAEHRETAEVVEQLGKWKAYYFCSSSNAPCCCDGLASPDTMLGLAYTSVASFQTGA